MLHLRIFVLGYLDSVLGRLRFTVWSFTYFDTHELQLGGKVSVEVCISSPQPYTQKQGPRLIIFFDGLVLGAGSAFYCRRCAVDTPSADFRVSGFPVHYA